MTTTDPTAEGIEWKRPPVTYIDAARAVGKALRERRGEWAVVVRGATNREAWNLQHALEHGETPSPYTDKLEVRVVATHPDPVARRLRLWFCRYDVYARAAEHIA